MTLTAMEREVEYQREMEESIARDTREERDERIRENFALGQIMELGRECRQFWESKVGRFILDRATNDSEAAKRDLVAVKRANYSNSFEYEAAITEMQQRAFIPELVWNWLNEAIRAAYEAEQLITEKEEVEDEY